MAVPELAHYVADWPRDGDLGFVAQDATTPVGAAWWRVFTEQDRGYGFIDDHTPEVSIGVVPAARRRGVGTMLLQALIDEWRRSPRRALGLSVEADNPAVALYERFGFETLLLDAGSLLMVLRSPTGSSSRRAISDSPHASATTGCRGVLSGQTGEMVHESVHVSTTIDRSARDVYDYASNPVNLSAWAAGLTHQEVQLADGQWVVDSPMGRVTVAFAPSNDFGILDHVVTLPDGETVHNPMRTIPNGDGCDVVFTVRRRTGMSETDFAADVDTVTNDLAALRALLEH